MSDQRRMERRERGGVGWCAENKKCETFQERIKGEKAGIGRATICEDEALVESLEDVREGQVAQVDAAAIVAQEGLVGVLQARDAHDHVLVRDERALGHALHSGVGGGNQGDVQQGGAGDATRIKARDNRLSHQGDSR
jgi:hypothetical protein